MTIATHLLQSTVCVAIAALVALALKRAPARTRHTIWLLASVKFLVPFSLFTAAGGYFGARTFAMATPSVSVVIRWIDQSLSFWRLDVAAGASVAGFPLAVDRLVLVSIAAVWVSGVAGLAVWRWRQWRDVARLAHALPHLENGREAETLRRVSQMAARAPRIVILRSRASVEPGVLGVFQPRLFWPDGLSDRLTDAELESVLAHEVCHISRRDNLSALMHVVVETLFWFHPAVWWVGSRLVNERERACDEEAMKTVLVHLSQGQAAELIERLLAGIGLERSEVYLTTVLKCRPPGNRDPHADEVAACEPYLSVSSSSCARGSWRRSGTSQRSCSRADPTGSRPCTVNRRSFVLGGERHRVPALPPRGSALHAGDAGRARGSTSL